MFNGGLMENSFKATNDTLVMVVEAVGGMYHPAQLVLLANLCDEKSMISKITEDQRIAIFVKNVDVKEVSKLIISSGLKVRAYQQGLHQPVTCIGGLCPFHKQDALKDGIKLSQDLAGLQVSHAVRIGINGCETACVPSQTLDFSIMGTEGGYNIFLGGKNSHLAEMASLSAEGVPAEELSKHVKDILNIYTKQAQTDESFHENIERIGSSPYLDSLSPYSQNAPSMNVGDLLQVHDKEESVNIKEISSIDNMEQSGGSEEEIPLLMSDDTENEEELSVDDLNFEDIGVEADIDPASSHIKNEVGEEILLEGDKESVDDEFENFDEGFTEPESVLVVDDQEIDVVDKIKNEDDFEDKLEDELRSTRPASPEENERIDDRKMALQFVEDDNINLPIEEIEENMNHSPEESSLDSKSDWELEGVSLSAKKQIVINFSKGTSVELESESFGSKPRVIKFGSKTISIVPQQSVVQVEVDGMKFTFPFKAA